MDSGGIGSGGLRWLRLRLGYKGTSGSRDLGAAPAMSLEIKDAAPDLKV